MSKEASKQQRKLLIRTAVVGGVAYLALPDNPVAYLLFGALGTLLVLALSGRLAVRPVQRGQVWIAVLFTLGVHAIGEGLGVPGFFFITIAWIYLVVLLFRAIGVFLKIILGALTLFMLLAGGLALLLALETQEQQKELTEERPEPEPTVTPDLPPPLSDSLIVHLQEWQDYSQEMRYSGQLEVRGKDSYSSTHYRIDTLQPPRQWESSYDYWGRIYQDLYQHDREGLRRIVRMFRRMEEHYGLNRQELADLVVSCIQHIPYNLVIQGSCADYIRENPDYKGTPCYGKTKYGIHAPVEFIAKLGGDCDTRTVFLFAVLGELGYTVAILNSMNYGHSVIGMALPGQGDFVAYRNKKYYTWETTGRGWQMGQLPPVFSNVNYWEVALSLPEK